MCSLLCSSVYGIAIVHVFLQKIKSFDCVQTFIEIFNEALKHF